MPASQSDSLASILEGDCFCVDVDREALHAQVEQVLRAHELPASLADSHPHLFASLPMFVAPAQLQQVSRVVASLERAVATPVYREAVLAGAPPAVAFDPGSPGGLLGLDFHLAADGPKLIEINTNPGGVLLNAVLAGAHDCCLPQTAVSPPRTEALEAAVLDVLRSEWRAQRGDAPLRRVAIVDENPSGQYLYPEFLMFRQLLQHHGHEAIVCDPAELEHRDGALWLGDGPVDFVYNRLNDFALSDPAHSALHDALLAGDVALSPHPRAHALYADKRNLVLLGDAAFLRNAGVDEADVAVLVNSVPETQRVTADNRDALWAERRMWFFKPAAGYGSRASYRGDKLTRRVWDEIGAGNYVAQRVVPPSERRTLDEAGPLKVDIRCYAYQGRVLLYAARMYRGQTTNFRTPGGGFAPVLALPGNAGGCC
jgi:hypothetical protein